MSQIDENQGSILCITLEMWMANKSRNQLIKIVNQSN